MDTRDNDCTVTTHHSTRVWLNGDSTQVFFGLLSHSAAHPFSRRVVSCSADAQGDRRRLTVHLDLFFKNWSSQAEP